MNSGERNRNSGTLSFNDLITQEDLQQFKKELLTETKCLLEQLLPTYPARDPNNWLRSKVIEERLDLSSSQLFTLRKEKKIPFSRLDGIFYYPWDMIDHILQEGVTFRE